MHQSWEPLGLPLIFLLSLSLPPFPLPPPFSILFTLLFSISSPRFPFQENPKMRSLLFNSHENPSSPPRGGLPVFR